MLNGVDAIVFTGGIGEHSDLMRRLVMEDMEYLGVDFDFEANKGRGDGVRVISKPDSKVKVLILPTNEELSIARETQALANNQNTSFLRRKAHFARKCLKSAKTSKNTFKNQRNFEKAFDISLFILYNQNAV